MHGEGRKQESQAYIPRHRWFDGTRHGLNEREVMKKTFDCAKRGMSKWL